jgi:hypothetical protein
MNTIIQALIPVLQGTIVAAAKRLAGSMLPRLVALVADAQAQFGKGTGAEKKAWLIDRLKQEREFAYSTLAMLSPLFLSVVVDAIVAWVKTAGAQK